MFGGTGGTGDKVVSITPPPPLSVGVSLSFNIPVTSAGPGDQALTGTLDRLNRSVTDPT